MEQATFLDSLLIDHSDFARTSKRPSVKREQRRMAVILLPAPFPRVFDLYSPLSPPPTPVHPIPYSLLRIYSEKGPRPPFF